METLERPGIAQCFELLFAIICKNGIEPIKKDFKSPEKVLKNWEGKFSFKQEIPSEDIEGLRAPQIGALHAISAHFSVGKQHEPATVVLPTGTGKTETMLASLVYNRLGKLLVLVPSDPLRAQIFEKFLTLGFLPFIGVTPFDIARPRVAAIKVGIRNTAEAEAILKEANVIIATPDILRSSSDEAIDTLCDGCSDLYIDEAHHATAFTWNMIRERFLQKRIVQFTATPFRNDGKHIGGKIIFNYRLGDAQRDRIRKW